MNELKSINFSIFHLLGAALVLFISYKIVYNFSINARIRKLGARAPVRKTYLPYGLDMAYEVVTYALKDETYPLWVATFQKLCAPGRCTIEAGVGGRIVLTADPGG